MGGRSQQCVVGAACEVAAVQEDEFGDAPHRAHLTRAQHAAVRQHDTALGPRLAMAGHMQRAVVAREQIA